MVRIPHCRPCFLADTFAPPLIVRQPGQDRVLPMTYHLTVERKPTYLHVIGTGSFTEENARRFLVEAHRASVELNCGSLLLDVRFTGPSMNLGSVYSIISERSPDGSMLDRIAYVDANPAHVAEVAEFAALVAMNRGVNVRLFSSVSEAERWLQVSERKQ